MEGERRKRVICIESPINILKNMKRSIRSGMRMSMDISERSSPLPSANTSTAGSWKNIRPCGRSLTQGLPPSKPGLPRSISNPAAQDNYLRKQINLFFNKLICFKVLIIFVPFVVFHIEPIQIFFGFVVSEVFLFFVIVHGCLLYTSPSPRD